MTVGRVVIDVDAHGRTLGPSGAIAPPPELAVCGARHPFFAAFPCMLAPHWGQGEHANPDVPAPGARTWRYASEPARKA